MSWTDYDNLQFDVCSSVLLDSVAAYNSVPAAVVYVAILLGWDRTVLKTSVITNAVVMAPAMS